MTANLSKWAPAASTLLASATYVVAWTMPIGDGSFARSLVLAFFLEFFLLHSAVMVPVAANFGRGKVIALAAAYAVMALGVGLGAGFYTFVSFVYLTAIEVLPALREKDPNVVGTALVGLGKLLLYGVVLVPVVLLPLPELAVVVADRSEDAQPQNVLAAGFVYFLILGCIRFRLARD